MTTKKMMITGLILVSAVGLASAQSWGGGLGRWLSEKTEVVGTWSKDAAQSALDTITSYAKTGSSLTSDQIAGARARLARLNEHASELADQAVKLNAQIAERVGIYPSKMAGALTWTLGPIVLPSAVALGAAGSAAYLGSETVSKFIDEALDKLKPGADITAGEVSAILEQAETGLSTAQQSAEHAENILATAGKTGTRA